MRAVRRDGYSLVAGISVCAALSLFPAATYSAETPLKKLTVAYTSFAPSMLWFLLEKDLGFFRDEGLSPEFILVRNSDIAIKGLIAGNFDYITPTGTTMDAIIRGRQPLKLLFTSIRVHYALVARREIQSVTDLKGKTIAVASLGSSNDLIMREILRRHGLDPSRDANFLWVGASRERFAALSSGAIQATFLSSPFDLRAVESGYRRIAKAGDYVKWPQAGLATNDLRLHREPQEVSKTVRASLKGLKFVLTQRQYVVPKMMQMFRLSQQEAAHSYEALQEEIVAPGYLLEQEQRAVISMIKHAANNDENIPPERVFDNRFAIQAEQDLKGWQPQVPKK